jgi:nicotinamidase-related amidase
MLKPECRVGSLQGKAMPLTKLDDNAALVVIDLQKGIAGLPTVHPAAEIIGRASQLARAFRERNLPIVLVNVTASAPGRTDAGPRNFQRPADWAELVPELDEQPGDHLVSNNVRARLSAHRWITIFAGAE